MPFLFQRSDPEQKQSMPAQIIQQDTANHIEWWRIVGMVIVTVVFLWISAIGYTGYQCSRLYVYTCGAQVLAFWSLPVVVLIAITFICIGGSVLLLISWRNKAEKERAANAFTQHYDIYDIKLMQKMVIEQVASEVAKSLASAEIDTWSPTNSSHSETSTTSVETTPENKDTPVLDTNNILEDLRARGVINRSDNSLFVGYTDET